MFFASSFACLLLTSCMVQGQQDIPSSWDGLDWGELGKERQKYLTGLGWTENRWECGTDEHLLSWHELSKNRQRVWSARRYNEESWNRKRQDPCKPRATHSTSEEFNPLVVRLDIPELQALTLDNLGKWGNTEIRLVDGYAQHQEEYESEDFSDKQTLQDFVQDVKNGKTVRYLHLEEEMEEKNHLHDLGDLVLKHIHEAIKKNDVLLETSQYKSEWDNLDKDSYEWGLFVGAKGTTNHAHFDSDVFNFLYLVEGKKRLVIVPNDERTVHTLSLKLNEDGGTGWLNTNLLNSTHPFPEYAVELELNAGEGIAIPYLSWHAVENLEASLAYSFRVID